MYKLLTTCRDFKEPEKGMFRIAQRISVQLLVSGLKQLDIKLMGGRDKSQFRHVNKKTRTLVTPFGEVEIERRYYKDRKTGERKVLLDEVLGLEEGKRLSP